MIRLIGTGALLCAAVVVVFTAVAHAERPDIREWRPKGNNPMVDASLPLVFRSAGDTTWVRVYNPGTSPCDPADTANSPTGQTIEHVWCFEGSGGDSTWPAQAPNDISETWRHWSMYNPPLPQPSRWHITTRHGGTPTGSFNAWAGCDSLGTNPACNDVTFWIFQEGYGDDWNYSLVLDCSGIDATGGGTLTFDVRYDVECNYDYLYLEYYDGSGWDLVEDGSGTPAIFNAVSGNFISLPNTGRRCGDDYFGTSDQRDLGAGNESYHGNSIWLTGVSFPIPASSVGVQLRWRAFSDGAWSDADGRGDTDGIGAIDNVSAAFTVGPTTVTDDFETGDFNGITTTGPGTAASWNPGGLEGNTYDGWHLQFDPKYKNKGNTCTFSDDWMWAAKPASGPIPENGFTFYLVSPVIPCSGWTGGIVEYSGYLCMLDVIEDYTNQECRFYDTVTGDWSLWNDFDDFFTPVGCEFWNFNDYKDIEFLII